MINREKSGENKTEEKVNREISAENIRIVGDNIDNGIYSFQEALYLAEKMCLDLVEVSRSGTTSICKVVDYKKYKYDKKKKEKEIKANSQKVEIKNIKFKHCTDQHDVDVKVRNIRAFIEKGNRVICFAFARRGREQFKEDAMNLLMSVAKSLEDCAKVDKIPTIDKDKVGLSQKLMLLLSPK